MAANILSSDLGRTSDALAAARNQFLESDETPNTFNTRTGSPRKIPNPKFGVQRYAGDIFQGKGIKGEFALAITDPKNKEARQGTEEWMNQYMSGIHAPLVMGPPPGGVA